jgi:hypothetical protein
MSLNMTMGRREAALDAMAEQVEAEAAPVARLWLQDLLVVTGTALGVLLSALLGVLLFMH